MILSIILQATKAPFNKSALFTPPDIIRYNNDITGGVFMVMVMISLFFVAFMSLKRNENNTAAEAFTGAGIITSIIGSLFWAMKSSDGTSILDWRVLIFSYSFAVLGIILMYVRKE